MSFFRKKPTIPHQGIVDRIAPVRASEFGLAHGFTLKGETRIYTTTTAELSERQCLTREGDVVSFMTKEGSDYVVSTTFINETIQNGRSSL